MQKQENFGFIKLQNMELNVYSYVKVWVRDKVETNTNDIQESINKVLDDDVEYIDTEVLWDTYEGSMDPKENEYDSTLIIKSKNDKLIYKN